MFFFSNLGIFISLITTTTKKYVDRHKECFSPVFLVSIHLDMSLLLECETKTLRAQLWDNIESFPTAHAVLAVYTKTLKVCLRMLQSHDRLVAVSLHQFRRIFGIS